MARILTTILVSRDRSNRILLSNRCSAFEYLNIYNFFGGSVRSTASVCGRQNTGPASRRIIADCSNSRRSSRRMVQLHDFPLIKQATCIGYVGVGNRSSSVIAIA